MIKRLILEMGLFCVSICFLPIAFACASLARLKFKSINKPRLVWGSTPIINNSYWSRAMRDAGFVSETFTINFYSKINKRSDWDKVLDEEYRWIPWHIKRFVAFMHALFLYDVFFLSFDGFFIGNTPIRYFQAQLLKLAGKKIIIIPYGSDAYVYKNVRSITLINGLLLSYPLASRQQERIEKNVAYWTKHADALIPSFMGPDGFGRWDTLISSTLCLDLNQWKSSKKFNKSDGSFEEVVIVHAPNHRGIKGTEFIKHAVNELKKEGLKISFKLIEGLQNNQVKEILEIDADILVEQLIFTGHSMNGLEGLASGLPTISNLEDVSYTLPLRRWSYFDECPIVSATPENLVNVLRKLITNPDLRLELGKAGRAYVEKYHGLDSAQYLFTNAIDYVHGKNEGFPYLYHPILGEYPKRSPKIRHPLVNNRIVDK